MPEPVAPGQLWRYAYGDVFYLVLSSGHSDGVDHDLWAIASWGSLMCFQPLALMSFRPRRKLPDRWFHEHCRLVSSPVSPGPAAGREP